MKGGNCLEIIIHSLPVCAHLVSRGAVFSVLSFQGCLCCKQPWEIEAMSPFGANYWQTHQCKRSGFFKLRVSLFFLQLTACAGVT